jgi:hypothetical protein
MTEFRPGDRVLVTADCLPAGGMLGTWSDDADSLMLDAKCESHGSQWLAISSRTHGEVTMTVHYRLRPPRPPDPEPFTRSDGVAVEWRLGEFNAPKACGAQTAEDARMFAAGYERIAAILEWKATE